MKRPPRTPRDWPRQLATTALALAAASCGSVEWNAPTSREVWRGHALRETALAGVVATTENGAGEAHARYETVVRAMTKTNIDLPERPLLIVIEADDPLLCGDADATLAAFRAWHPELEQQGLMTSDAKAGHDESAGDRELMMDFALRSQAVRPPMDAPELGLPVAWQRQFAWVLVLPSDSCLETLFDRFLDRALEKEGIGFGTRLLMAPLMPLVRSEGRATLQSAVMMRILSAALAGRKGLDPEALRACIGELGLDDLAVKVESERMQALSQ